MPVVAAEFDMSIDDSIRKNYNPSKIDDDSALPALPKIRMDEINSQTSQSVNEAKVSNTLKSKQISNNSQSKHINLNNSTQEFQQSASTEAYYAVIKKGKHFRVRCLSNVSDTFKKGTRINFVSKYPVSSTCYTIPAGTIFKGTVINAHRPQFTGNGGLIIINIDSIVLNGNVHPISAYVTKANSKHIFRNTIKGKRRYIHSMLTSSKPGCHYFGKMMRLTANLATDGSSIFVSPFSFLVGCFALAGNVLVSPVLAVFHKGDSLQIPAGSSFEIKLSQDVYIYN